MKSLTVKIFIFYFIQEYYKFHKDIPRMFMDKICIPINKFYEKKRFIEYVKIKKMLKLDLSKQPKSEKEKKPLKK